MFKKLYLFLTLLTAFLWLGSGTMWGNEITVMDDSYYYRYVPVDGYSLDGAQHNQLLLLASEISAMNGSNITGMKFYFDKTGHSWSSSSVPSVTFKLKEVANTSLSSLVTVDASFTTVYSGSINFSFTDKEWSITFSTPYTYNGGNLLIDIQTVAYGAYVKKSGTSYMRFYTKEISGRAMTGSTARSNFPKTTFTYEDAADPSGCNKPKNLTKSADLPDGATFTWEQNASETTYQWACVTSGATVEEWATLAENVRTKTVTGLTAGTAYDFCVRSYCGSGESEQSELVKKTFTPECPAPTAPQLTDVATTTATLSWTAAAGISNYQYIVVNRDAAEDWTSPTLVEGAVTTPLSGLTAGTKYDVYVRSYYNATTVSASVKGQFQTPCNAMSIADFDGTFESETAGSGLMPNCWEAAASYDYSDYYSSTTTTYPCVKNSFSSANNGDKCLALYGGASSSVNIAVLPVFEEALNTLTVSFYYKNTSTYGGYISFGYYKDGTFTAFAGASNLTRTTSYTQIEMAIPAVPEGARLAFQYAGGSYNYEADIDDVVISLTPSCTKPSIPVVSNIVYNGATVTWTENGSATNWKVQYSTDNTNWTTVNVSTNPTCTLTGLTTGTPYYVQVISVCGGTDGESPAVAAASTFTPTCVKPSTPTISATTTTTATIQWTVNSGEDEWYLQYKKPADSEWGEAIYVTTNPYTLTDLESGTTYRVHVTAGCKEDYTAAAEFITECEAKTLDGYTEGFEGFTTGSYAQTGLTCWGELNVVHSSSYSYPQMYVNTNSSYVKSGSKSLYLVSSSSTYEYAILPTFSGSYAGYQLTFSHKEESASSSGKIALGYLTDASDAGTFQVIKEFTRAESWTTETESINDVPDGARLAFRYGGGSNNYYAGIDDISITALPNCLVPTVVVASNETTNSASISWTNGAEETSWKLQYKAADDENWTAANEGNAFTTKPYTLESLAANTTYYVQVKAVCGGTDGESDWSASGEFETECNAIELADFATETFATSSVPNCWKVTTVGDKSWATTTSNYQRHSSPYAMQFAAYTEVGNFSDLISPAITLTEDAFLKFYLYNSYSSDPVVGEVYIQYGSTTTKIYDFVATNNVEQQVVDLAAYTGKTAKFIFRGHGNGQTNYRYASIDDVEVVAKPCDAPTGLSKVETSSSVVLSWTDEAASEWALRWREVTEPESEWTTVEDLTEQTLMLTTANDLAFDKTYQAQVQAVCTDVKSSEWSDLISFGLVCGAAPTNLTVSARTTNSATMTWTGAESAFSLETSLDGENWESPVAVNAKTYNLTGLSAGTTYYVRVQNACGGSYSNVVEFKTWCDSKLSLPVDLSSFSAMPACWEESPAGAISFNNSKLCFVGEGERFLYLPQTDVNLNLLSAMFTFSGSLEFGYIDAPNGAFQAFETQPTSGVELDLADEAAAAKYIAIRYNGANNLSQASISAVSIRKTPTCAKPTAVAGTPGEGSASISWTENGSAEAWNLQYKTGSDDWTTVAVTENPYALSGLEYGVSYKVRVQAACAGEDPSDWSDEASFTTSCANVAALPFIETFDAALSNCWDITDDDATYNPSQVSGGALSLPGGKAASGHLVKLPNITASFANATMTVIYRISTDGAVANAATPQVGYMDGEDFVQLEALTKTKSSTEARIELASANGHRLAIRFDDGASETTLVIEEIRILEQVTLADNVDNSETLAALNGQTVDVTIGRTIFCDGDYNTICLPFDLATLDGTPLEGATVKAFKYAVIEPEELQVRVIDVEGGLQAGVPYLLKMTADENLVSPLFKNVTISATAGKTVGQDQAVKFIGTFAPVAFEADNQSTLFVHTNNTLTWSGKDNTSLKAFRAYFQRTSAPTSAPLKPGMRARIVEHNEATTGINNTNVENVTLKFIENDQVVIIRNGVKYNIQGQVISK